MPVDGSGAEWQPPGARDRRLPEGPDEVRRLEAALDRFSRAIVRRAERDAEAADRLVAGAQTGPSFDGEATEELRRRLDALIGRVRGLLGDAAP